MRFYTAQRIGILLITAFFLAGCGGQAAAPVAKPSAPAPNLRTQRPYQINGIWYYPLPTAEGYTEEGIASWYGPNFHGKATSCGEIYDMHAMTAAHKTLPLGTHVKVTNLTNGQSCILRVNDRGPFVAGRIIDLSFRAANEVGVAQKGTAKVRVEAVQVASEQHVGQNTYWKVDPVPSFRYGRFNIQVGAFRDQMNAYRLRNDLSMKYQGVQFYPVTCPDGYMYRVQIGTYDDMMVAQKELEKLRSTGFRDAFIVAVEGT